MILDTIQLSTGAALLASVVTHLGTLTALEQSNQPATPTSAIAQHAAPAGGGDNSGEVITLRRRGLAGVASEASGESVRITAVRPSSAAAKAGLLAGDLITEFDGQPVRGGPAGVAEFSARIREKRAGEQITLKFERQGEVKTTTITLDALPGETIAGSVVSYRAVTHPAGYPLRTIVSVPNGASPSNRKPALMFVQGIFCASLDRPTQPEAPDTRFIHDMAKAGYVTLRVDKPGLGDSQGPPCGQINFRTELEGYAAALKSLAEMPEVDPSQIYIFGHSMGGVMAPYLAERTPLAGVVVYGTLARTWMEYSLENIRRQASLMGASQSEVSSEVQRQSLMLSDVLLRKRTLGQFWSDHPDLKPEPAEMAASMLDAEHMYSRHMTFFHELQDLNIAEQWGKVKSRVLALHGEYDWVAPADDHAMIASIVAHERSAARAGESPRSAAKPAPRAVFRTLPKFDHGLTRHESLEDSLRAMGQGENDGELAEAVLKWIGESK